ncbi:MAG TPA: transposase [Candidatus Dormibacteraeota bacterium]|nr:transposase [Candidatus Dormibacteraeota bacterium]
MGPSDLRGGVPQTEFGPGECPQGIPGAGWGNQGRLDRLGAPKLRSGRYLPTWLVEPRAKGGHGPGGGGASACLAAVPTRRVEGLVQELAIERVPRSQVLALAQSLDEMTEDSRTRPLDQGRTHTCGWTPWPTEAGRAGGV